MYVHHEVTMFEIVVATDDRNGIGLAGKLPWRCRDDMQHFKTLTTASPDETCNAVIMGRLTWESLPAASRPLPGRKNIVLSSSQRSLQVEGVLCAQSLDAALAECVIDPKIHRIFVIGGGRVYAEAIRHHQCTAIHASVVDYVGPCDTFFPEVDQAVWVAADDKWVAADDERVSARVKAVCNLSRIVTYKRRI